MTTTEVFTWGFRWNADLPPNDVYVHRGIDGSFIVKVGSLNHTTPSFEGDYDELVSYLEDLAQVSPYAIEMLTKIREAKWVIKHGRYFLDID